MERCESHHAAAAVVAVERDEEEAAAPYDDCSNNDLVLVVDNTARMKCATSRCGLESAASVAADAAQRALSSRKLVKAVVLCLIFMMLEVAGGIFANSLAILTDAAHLLSDVAGFAISLFAIWAASWEATPNQSFGFYRLEILGALVSIQLIWLLTGILVYEAIHRLFGPSQPVDGRIMFFVATLGLLVNLAMVFLLGHDGHAHGHDHSHNHGHSNGHTHKDEHVHNHANSHSEHTEEDIGDGHGRNRQHDHGSHCHGEHTHGSPSGRTADHGPEVHSHELAEPLLKSNKDLLVCRSDSAGKRPQENINVQGAYLHVLGDLVQSVGVMIAGGLIWFNPEWQILDLICTLLFSALVLGTTIQMLRNILEVLMESTPREIDAPAVENGLLRFPGVVAVHELHIWAITVGKSLLACHIRVEPHVNTDEILQAVTDYCESVHKISHVTIQVERDR